MNDKPLGFINPESIVAMRNIVTIFRSLVPPDDDTLRDLDVAIRLNPNEDTPRLMKIDRLLELGCTQLAEWERMILTMQQYQRRMFDSIIASFGVPAHLLGTATFDPNGVSSCMSFSPKTDKQ